MGNWYNRWRLKFADSPAAIFCCWYFVSTFPTVSIIGIVHDPPVSENICRRRESNQPAHPAPFPFSLAASRSFIETRPVHAAWCYHQSDCKESIQSTPMHFESKAPIELYSRLVILYFTILYSRPFYGNLSYVLVLNGGRVRSFFRFTALPRFSAKQNCPVKSTYETNHSGEREWFKKRGKDNAGKRSSTIN